MATLSDIKIAVDRLLSDPNAHIIASTDMNAIVWAVANLTTGNPTLNDYQVRLIANLAKMNRLLPSIVSFQAHPVLAAAWRQRFVAAMSAVIYRAGCPDGYYTVPQLPDRLGGIDFSDEARFALPKLALVGTALDLDWPTQGDLTKRFRNWAVSSGSEPRLPADLVTLKTTATLVIEQNMVQFWIDDLR